MTPRRFRTLAAPLALLACLSCSTALAQGFSALVSPPRFEDRVQPGDTYRNVIEINNVSDSTSHFTVQTADWTFSPDATVEFSDALAPGSCRPWVGIEAADITLGPNAKRRYRFEVKVPADAPDGECRFAIMIEGDPYTPQAGAAIPISGRIGVIVYLAVGDAAPELAVVGHDVQTINGNAVPVLSLRNDGNAHGRLQGFVGGSDAGGAEYAFVPSSLPILPGETRKIALQPQPDNADMPVPVLAYPLQLEGTLESGAQRLDIKHSFSR